MPSSYFTFFNFEKKYHVLIIIVVSSNVFNTICSNDVTETPVNPSTHCPVTLTFRTNYSSLYTDTRSADLRKCYNDRIDLLLDSIDIPQNSVHCTDVLCENDSHRLTFILALRLEHVRAYQTAGDYLLESANIDIGAAA